MNLVETLEIRHGELRVVTDKTDFENEMISSMRSFNIP
jgi:hypothetical protein